MKEKEGRGLGEEGDGMGGKEGKGGEGEREGKGGERGEDVEGPGSGLPRGPCWLSAGLGRRGRKEGGRGAIKTPLLNGLATGLSFCIMYFYLNK